MIVRVFRTSAKYNSTLVASYSTSSRSSSRLSSLRSLSSSFPLAFSKTWTSALVPAGANPFRPCRPCPFLLCPFHSFHRYLSCRAVLQGMERLDESVQASTKDRKFIAWRATYLWFAVFNVVLLSQRSKFSLRQQFFFHLHNFFHHEHFHTHIHRH